MNCNQCKNKLTEYIEESLSNEEDEEIMNHLLICKSCKEHYEKEELRYKAFKEYFSHEDINFSDSTNKIMENIDKNKYTRGKKGMKKRYKGAFAIAAAFLLGVIVTPVAMKLMDGDGSFSSASKGMESKSAKQSDLESNSVKKSNNIGETTKENIEDVPDIASSSEESNDAINRIANIDSVNLYVKNEVDMSKELTFNTPFIVTENGQYEASIEGKGETANEEGIGILYIRDKSNNKMYEYTTSEKDSQKSPLSINWYDDTHLMIVHGLGYGTLVNGESIIMLDVTTGEQILITTAKDKERFISIEREKDSLVLKYVLYVDEMMNDKEKKSKTFDNYHLGDIVEVE